MKIEIRAADEADIEDVRACAERAYSIYVQRIGRKPAPMVADFEAAGRQGALYVCRLAESLAGYVVFYSRGRHIHLENLAVDPACQQRGIGTRLIAFVEAEARQRGADCIELYTNARMYENLVLYPRLGFRQFDRRTEAGFDRVYFRKVL